MAGPRDSFVVDGEPDWHLLLGDATALPAIRRRIEEYPPESRIVAVVEVAGAAEEQRFETGADLALTWLHAEAGQSILGHLGALALPAGEGFAVLAAEAGTVARGHARLADLDLPEAHLKAASHWRRGAAEDHAS